MIFRTTAQDVLDLFNVTSLTEAVLQRWLDHPAKKDTVVPQVLAHQTSTIYRLTPEDVERVCMSTEHALGEVKRATAESVKAIVDWHPDFAFTHTFHLAVESLETLPTWQQFRAFVHDDSRGNEMLWRPAQDKITQVSSAPDGPSRAVATDSMRWRVGNAYYSFLREIFVVVHLRNAGLDVRMHPLADALFRVDFWCGRTVCSLLVKNAKFHKDGQGRKVPTSELLAGAVPPFHFHPIQLERASRFGVVHLPSLEQVRVAASRLHTALHASAAS
ncbi:hypothetical protein ACIBK9_51335 [Nonomuraea sp. NPDC050227]|uniref:hypothetical protein n=1 Tax=Nonomuraea sp. NPDC050227 TaxID=3364360 RepID=UPI0037BC07D2